MLRKVSFGLAGLAAVGLAGQAMAAGQINNQNYQVDVTINVAEEVSLWMNHATRTLDMVGNDGNNSATTTSGLNYINNVNASISVNAKGKGPDPIVPGGGVNFFIFGNTTEPAAVAAIAGNAYNPVGALSWSPAERDGAGTTKTFNPSVGINTSAVAVPIVYASASPGELPLPTTFVVEVLWTIAPTAP